MKINFWGSYRDVSQLLDARLKRSETVPPKEAFGALLGDIAPGRAKKVENTTHPTPLTQTAPAPVADEDHGPMARLNFSPPTVELPKPERVPLTDQLVTIETPAMPSVKTPTLVQARRIAPNDHLADLPKAERMTEVRKLIVGAGDRHGVDPALSMAVVSAESAFNPNAISSDGHLSKGLFQLLDKTGQHLHVKNGAAAPYNPFDPEQNIELGLGYLRHLHDLFSVPSALTNDTTTVPAANSASLEKLAVAAFNAGEGRVASAQERARANGRDPAEYDQISQYLPESTRNYVVRVMAYRDQFGVEFES